MAIEGRYENYHSKSRHCLRSSIEIVAYQKMNGMRSSVSEIWRFTSIAGGSKFAI
jgi:hypothetical protein